MREYSNLSLLIVDIDYFKEFNDRYGHLAGDDCLKQVAATLGGTMRRASDLVARYGGDEFTCVLPGTGEQRAVKVAQRIADEVAGLSIPHESSSVAGHVTVSIGVATEVPEKGREYSDLISRADRCLYAAKDQGRNRVVALLDDYSNKERPDGRRSRSTDRAGT
jgi:diguanylate cyclase (GGDEF)-like protein